MSVPREEFYEPVECASAVQPGELESLPGKTVALGDLPVTRVLPLRQKRMIGPWCFADRFGPMTFAERHPMDVAPHPHTGLQTVTWLLDGEIRHDDSLGCQTVTRPGGVSVMTAGRGIAHSEQTPEVNSHRLNGVQLWVAQPDSVRSGGPSFAAISEVPRLEVSGGLVQLFAGAAWGIQSPAPHASPILGADLEIWPGQSLEIDLTSGWEYALILLSGDASLEGRQLAPEQLHSLGASRSAAEIASRSGGRLLLLGGPPFPEKILMWWNFIVRTPAELTEAREDWMERRRFGDVAAYRGGWLRAPEIVGTVRKPGE